MNDNNLDNELSTSTKSYVISRYFSCTHLLMGFLLTYISVIFSKSSDYGLGGIMQRSLHMHAYLCPLNDIHANSRSAVSLLTAANWN